MPWRRALYRSRQVWHALRPRLDADALELTRRLLSPAERDIFFAMQRRDQRHALEVAGRLIAQDQDDTDLLAAALLHDCGKGAVPVWLRIVKVLAPGRLAEAAVADDAGWRGAAYRLVHHPALGAAQLAAAGANPTTVRLVRGDVLPSERLRFEALLAADDAS